MNRWKKLFLNIMYSEIGMRYALGGGQMRKWIHRDKKTKEIIAIYNNFDKNGNPVGFDCSGGIMWALEKTYDMLFEDKTPHGILTKSWWLTEIKESELQSGNLIFVDLPKIIKTDGTIDYGNINHVMTYIGDTKKGDIITTEGTGGDFRINPKSRCKTIYWNFKSFKKISAKVSKGLTKYRFGKINWKSLEHWKVTH